MKFFSPVKDVDLNDYVPYCQVMNYLGFIGSTFSITDKRNRDGNIVTDFQLGRNSKIFTGCLFRSLSLDSSPDLIVSDGSHTFGYESYFYKKSFLDKIDLNSVMENPETAIFLDSKGKTKYYKSFEALILDRYEDYSENIFYKDGKILYMDYRKKMDLIEKYHKEHYDSLRKGAKNRWFNSFYGKGKAPKEDVINYLIDLYEKEKITFLR